MPLNFEDVKTSLFDWASSQVPLGYEVIFYYPNAPRPKSPYVSLYVMNIITVNQDYTYPNTSITGEIQMKGDRQFTLQIQAYGNDPLTVVENLRTSLQKQSVLDTLRSNGIVFYQALSVNDITNLIDSQYEKRAQLDVLMGIGQTYSDNLGFFDEVEIEQEYLSADSTIVYADDIVITVN